MILIVTNEPRSINSIGAFDSPDARSYYIGFMTSATFGPPAFVKVLIRRFLLLVLAYTLCRVVFLLWNHPMFVADSVWQIARAFAYGLRFDMAAILLTNMILIPLWLIPLDWDAWPALKRVELLLFGLINVVALGLNFIDTEFVNFIGKRSSFELLMMREDIQRQAISLVSYYWYLALGPVILLAVLIRIAPRFTNEPFWRPWWNHLAWRLGLLALVVLGIRGGFQLKPLHPMDAYFSTQRELGLLTLNTPFTMIRSQARGNVNQAHYFPDEKEVILRLKKLSDLSRPPLALASGWNVVFIIIESFSTEYTGVANDYPGHTPFFDSLARRPGAFFFKQSFANASRSIEGLPAIVCGLPALMDAPILTSDFSNNNFTCLPKVLAQRGYSTHFLHGAHNGSMRFDTFARIAGFEHFVGLNEYPKDKPDDFDGHWGVLDEPMLQYAVKTIDQAPKPVFLGLFTLSSHHPYYIPPKHRGKFPKGTLEIHESIGYADHALAEFFASARQRPWFNQTIFVITGDHTQKSDHKEYGQNMLGWNRVPLLIYAPGLAGRGVTADPERIVQHIDAAPSVLDLLGINPTERLLVGQSVFDGGTEGRAYNWTGYSFWYVDPRVVIEMKRAGGEVSAWNHKNTWGYQERPRPAEGAEVETAVINLKSIIQYVSDGLLRNNLYSWREAL